LRRKIDDFNNGITGNIIINSGYTPGIHVLPHIILDFKKLHQNINIHYDISTSRAIFRKLQNNTIDIGITAMATKQNMESVSFLSDQLVLVLPVHHHLTMKKSIQVRDLSGEKLLSTKKGSATRILIDELTEKYNISPEIIEIGSPFAIVKAIESGNGITFMSKFAIQKEGNPKLIVIKNIEGLKFERSFYITDRTDKYQSKALKTFIDFFLKQYKT
jgi:LysR family transcriptional regulator, transcriptional activator of the cysJI operon